ncbi:MAG: NAD+ synthase [Chloroflexi bacterium]|nr:MAG: NAD+ synthase [Chloroflexota bacterium]MBL1195402.1 NAD+ synthase [Chloroflexota bacterium]NOH12685.1 NAD+ synthase [Chloroflexota bacterium]
MKVALAQINTTVGDLAGNVELCLQAIQAAKEQNVDLVVLPEMAVTGYPPRDILFDSSFIEAVQAANADLAKRAEGGPPAIVGSVIPADRKQAYHPSLFNAALLLHSGEASLAAAKQLLPSYDVFYEDRWFLSGPSSSPIDINGKKVGVLVCEDLWDEGYPVHPGTQLLKEGAELLVCINASPYHQGALANRQHHAKRQGAPIIYLNLVGATDELIFDGRSFALNADGDIIAQAPAFKEDLLIVEFDDREAQELQEMNLAEELYQAIVLGIRDFAGKNGLKKAFLGLSGGIDSAVGAVVATEAMGPKNLTAVHIPSRFTDPRSIQYSKILAKNLGIGYQEVALDAIHSASETALKKLLDGGTTAENIQARLRAMILMAFVNHHSGILLNTSNKTELALGYATLYGDMAGSLSPLGDLTKPQVYAIAEWINRGEEIIPAFIMDRAPSAELKDDQVDPFNYDEVGPKMEALVQANQSDAAMRRAEHKRWQMGVILKLSEKAFGTGRMIPITRR